MITLGRNSCSDISVDPIGENSRSIFEQREHAVIGVSPFNSYFNAENLSNLFNWALNSFKNVSIFIPTEISIYTLQAVGYSKERAAYKTKRQDAYLKNKVVKALIEQGISQNLVEDKIITTNTLLNNPNYELLYNNCLQEFKNNEAFRQDCLATSRWVLSNYKTLHQNNEDSLNIAVKYFLYEFPLFINTPAILNVASSTFIYHSVPRYLEYLYSNNIMISPNQGFVRAVISQPNVIENLSNRFESVHNSVYP